MNIIKWIDKTKSLRSAYIGDEIVEYIALPFSQKKVSRLCFGGLTVGPLQKNLSLAEGSAVLSYAIERGVNFVDTAQYYKTYSYIREAMRQTGKHDLVIATKTYAYDRKGAVEAFEEARRELDRDYIDLFLLHEQEDEWTMRGHREAYEFFLEQKMLGKIGGVGLSTHHIAGVIAGANNPDVDVCFPMYNYEGVGICDGGIDEMREAVQLAHSRGKFIYAMKVLGGGTLIPHYEKAVSFALDEPAIDAIAMGMQSKAEVDANISFFETRSINPSVSEKLAKMPRELHIDDWCIGCGNCVKRCAQGAISLIGGKAQVDLTRCVTCGYCARVCPEFCIKVI